MKSTRAFLLLVAATLLALPRSAHAVSHALNPTGRPAAVSTAGGTTRIFALAGHGESDTVLVWKDPDTDWQLVTPPPIVAPSYYDATGVTAVSIPGQAPAVYVVTVERTTYSYPAGYVTIPPALWEYVQGRTVGGTLSEWRKISDFPRGTSQTGSPAIASVRRSSTGEVWVAVRTFGDAATGSAVYACQTFGTTTPYCRNVTCDASSVCTYASNASPVALALNRGYSGLTQVWVEDVFTVNNAGSLQHYRHTEGATAWDKTRVVGTPAAPTGSHVDLTAIQLWPLDSTSVPSGQGGSGAGDYTEAAVVATAASGLPPTLQFLRKGTGLNATETWTWSHVYLWDKGGSGEVGADNGMGNLVLDRDPVSNVRRIWAISGVQADGTHAMHLCNLSTTPTTSTVNCDSNSTTDQYGAPTDTRPAFDGLGPAFTVRNDTVWTVASVGRNTANAAAGAEYLYSVAYFSDGEGTQGQWRNHLTWRDRMSTISAGTSVSEYAGAERYGTIVVMGVDRSAELSTGGESFARVWRSTDDGSTWTTWPAANCASPTQTGCTFVFPVTNSTTHTSDPSVAVTAGGEFFVATPEADTASTDSGWVALSHFNTSTQSWTAPFAVPGTNNDITDRPWFIADRIRDRTFHLAYSTSNARQGRFTTCTESAGQNCVDLAGDGWCVPFALRSKTGCYGNQHDPRSGCPVAQTDDGSVFVAVQDDLDCAQLTSGFPPSTLDTMASGSARTSGIGVRRVSIPTDGSCPTSASLGAPACLYLVRAGEASRVAISDPGQTSNWTLDLVTTEDGSNGLYAVAKSFVDSAGNPCFDTSGTCSAGIFVAYRDPSTSNWCGSTCSSQLTPSGMVRIDTPISGQNPMLPSLAAFDDGQFEVSWLDFLLPGTSSTYSPAGRVGSVNSGTHTIGSLSPVQGWHDASGATVTSSFLNCSDCAGDFDHAASARLHAHSFAPFYVSSPSGYQWMHRISSPAAQQ